MYMVTFHYHALRLIQEKFSLATNLHKVIKLISNKELWVWKKKSPCQWDWGRVSQCFPSEMQVGDIWRPCRHSNGTSNFASINTAPKSLIWGSHIESKCFRTAKLSFGLRPMRSFHFPLGGRLWEKWALHIHAHICLFTCTNMWRGIHTSTSTHSHPWESLIKNIKNKIVWDRASA